MVDILQAARFIAADGLEMRVCIGCDAYLRPGRRDRSSAIRLRSRCPTSRMPSLTKVKRSLAETRSIVSSLVSIRCSPRSSMAFCSTSPSAIAAIKISPTAEKPPNCPARSKLLGFHANVQTLAKFRSPLNLIGLTMATPAPGAPIMGFDMAAIHESLLVITSSSEEAGLSLD
jgi:hypothetical protein